MGRKLSLLQRQCRIKVTNTHNMSDILQNETKQDEIVTPQNAKPSAYSEFSIFSGPGGTLPTSSLATDYTSATGGTFGGNGSDGALSVSSGTTTIDLGGASVLTKNYSSISITGSGALTFTNPHSKGTVITLKSKGNVVLTSSATPMIDCSGLGAAGGSGGVPNTGSGNDGTAGVNNIQLETNFPDSGNLGVGGSGTTDGTGGGASTANKYSFPGDSIATASIYGYLTQFSTGGGGGGGGAGDGDMTDGGAGGAGGRGGGCLIIECAGALNFTTVNGLSVAGANGSAGSNGGAQGGGGGGGGGGGAGGIGIVIYNTLTAASGTINVSGGNGGNGGNGSSNVPTKPAAGGGGSGGANRYAGGAGGEGGITGGSSIDGANGSSGGGTGGGTGGTGGSGAGAPDPGHGGGGGGGGSAGNSYIVQNTAFA